MSAAPAAGDPLPGFDGIEFTVSNQRTQLVGCEQRLAALEACWVGQRRDAARAVNQLDRLSDGIGARLGGGQPQQMHAGPGGRAAQHPLLEHPQDERSTAGVPVSIPIEIGAPQSPADRIYFGQHAVDVLAHESARSIECGHQLGVMGVDEVAEDVDRFRTVPARRHLDAGHDLEGVGGGRYRFVDAGQDIVVGDGDGRQAALDGSFDRFARGKTAV